MSFTSVDLPEPETPVTTVITPSGKVDVDILQIVFARAQNRDRLAVCCARRSGRMSICVPPEMYAPVSESGAFIDLVRRAAAPRARRRDARRRGRDR